ncbi:MAG: hypothetical protein ACFFDY_00330 [Candidatus Thorarchaeota archaeon]
MKKNVALIGTFRKDSKGLVNIFNELRDLGYNITTPRNPIPDKNENGFVYMKGETIFTPDSIEERALFNIKKSDFVWFFSPNGYIGYTTLAEIGYALSIGKKIFSNSFIVNKSLNGLINIVENAKCLNDFKMRSNMINDIYLSEKFYKLSFDRKIEDLRKIELLIGEINKKLE